MDNLDSPLINNKNKNFSQLYEELVIKNQRLKKKNDHYQRLNPDELDYEMLAEIKGENQFIKSEIQAMKDIIFIIEDKFRDPKSKNKTKIIKPDCERQIDRYKRIIENILSKSFIQRRSSNNSNQAAKENYIVYKPIGNSEEKSSKRESNEQYSKQIFGEIDFELENKQMQEKKEGLKNAEAKIVNVNKILTDMSKQVNDHGEMLNIIDENMLKGKENVEATNQELEKASKNQKKSKKSCIIIVVLIIMMCFIIGGVVYFLKG